MITTGPQPSVVIASFLWTLLFSVHKSSHSHKIYNP